MSPALLAAVDLLVDNENGDVYFMQTSRLKSLNHCVGCVILARCDMTK
jgi:hypothetical protein